MSLEVNITKKLNGFTLHANFAARSTATAILGASGCGKSMTLRCIAGIVKPDAGRIVLDGRVLFDSALHIDLPPQQRGVGLPLPLKETLVMIVCHTPDNPPVLYIFLLLK